MVDNSNPFYVQPPNPLQALMLGQQSFNQAQDRTRENQIRQARADAAKLFGQGDTQGALSTLMSLDPHGAAVMAGITNQQAQRAFQEKQFANQIYQQSPEAITAAETARQRVAAEFAPKTVDIKTIGPLGDTQTQTMTKGPGGFQPIQIPGATTTQPSAPGQTSNVTGEDYITTLPPALAAIVKKVATYQINPASLSVKGGHRENIMAAASQYDPNFDAALAPARFAAIKEFNSGGQTAPAATIVAGNTAIQHLKTLSDASEKIGGINNLGPLNALGNRANVFYKGASNDPDLVEYKNALGRFVEEATKFYRGIGGNEADIQRGIADITAAQSPVARNRAIATQADLMASKINALQDRWRQATGPAGWSKITKDFPIVQGKSIGALNEILKRDNRLPYQSSPSETPDVTAPGATMSVTPANIPPANILQEAKAAIAKGAPRDAVIQRLKQQGFSASGL